MSADPIIRVVLVREIVYQGPASWVRDTLSRRIMGPQQMGERDRAALIVSARDVEISADLPADPAIETAAKTLQKLGVKQMHGISYEQFAADQVEQLRQQQRDLLMQHVQAMQNTQNAALSGKFDILKSLGLGGLTK
jgi:hypothetical protein